MSVTWAWQILKMATERSSSSSVPDLSPIHPKYRDVPESWDLGPTQSSPIPWDESRISISTPVSTPELRSFVNSADEDEIQRYCRKIFDNIDEDGLGFVTREDFERLCHDSFELAENLMSELDEDQDGKLSFDEFFHGFRSFARKLQDEGEGPIEASRTEIYNGEESVFESHSVVEEERWSRAASRMSLPENLAQSVHLKAFWNKVFDTNPQLAQQFESTLVEVGRQIKESKDSLQLLERHMKKKDSQHIAEVVSLEQELEGHLNNIISEYSAKGDSLEKTLEGRYNVAVVEREAEIEGLSSQLEKLKQQLRDKESKEYKLSANLHRFDACSFRNIFHSNQDIIGQRLAAQKRSASVGDIQNPYNLSNIKDSPLEESVAADYELKMDHSNLDSVSYASSTEELRETVRSIVVKERMSDIIGLTTPSDEVSILPPEVAGPPSNIHLNGTSEHLNSTGFDSKDSGLKSDSAISIVHPAPQFKTPSRVYKIVVLGDSGVGKTLLISNLCSATEESSRLQATVGVDYLTTVVQYKEETIALQFWDTAGQERFAPVCALYLRRADAVVVTYDITNRTSFENVRKWIELAKSAQRDDLTTYMLIGTKTDLGGKRVISTIMGQQKALALKALFCEVSSVERRNLQHVLASLSKVLLEVDNDELKKSKHVALSQSKSKCSC